MFAFYDNQVTNGAFYENILATAYMKENKLRIVFYQSIYR